MITQRSDIYDKMLDRVSQMNDYTVKTIDARNSFSEGDLMHFQAAKEEFLLRIDKVAVTKQIKSAHVKEILRSM
ncbi:hypothetical protein CS022_17075 [Veronia nyctiphanis]|uniref:Uncharacterized protein n=1 Tax=Veronia nyctiphanis TaxID=1278244 RepID=A0A4Q0YMX6_9GAMM|nr:hypothetical protein [Veronia nyctiphanis]RXJ72257.1 hypothetical protein CS022_17075 [Veronia nyctiphanis]